MPGKFMLAVVHGALVLHYMSCLSVKIWELASSRARDSRKGERQQEDPKQKPQETRKRSYNLVSKVK